MFRQETLGNCNVMSKETHNTDTALFRTQKCIIKCSARSYQKVAQQWVHPEKIGDAVSLEM